MSAIPARNKAKRNLPEVKVKSLHQKAALNRPKHLQKGGFNSTQAIGPDQAREHRVKAHKPKSQHEWQEKNGKMQNKSSSSKGENREVKGKPGEPLPNPGDADQANSAR